MSEAAAGAAVGAAAGAGASADPLRGWLERFLEHHGAVTEESGAGIAAVLPPGLVGRTGWHELERFTFVPGTPGHLVAYESGLLDELRPVVEESGSFAEARIRVAGQKTEGFEALVASRVAFANGIYRYNGAGNSEVGYLVAQYRATATSEERHEALVTAAVNELTGARAEGIAPWILEQLPTARAVPGARPDRALLARWAPRLGREALSAARGLFAELEKGLTRRLSRDVERLTEYYGAIEAEIRKKAEKKRLLGEELAREESRIEATRRELAHKLADQHARYALEIRLEPVALLRMWVGSTLMRLTLHRRKKSREVFLTYRYFDHQLEPPSCEACGVPLRQVWLCDDEIHVLCQACQRCARCGKAACLACQPHGCPIPGSGL